VSAAHYQEDTRRWDVILEDGRRYTTRFLITAVGALSAATMPRIPGVESFQGQSCHTHYWPKEPVRFEGKRVAVIGTGATGVQTITEVAKTGGHLTVLQPTPQWCAPLHNAKIGKEEMRRIRANYPEIFARCQETYGCFIHATDPRATHEVMAEEREAFWEKLYGEPGFGIWCARSRRVVGLAAPGTGTATRDVAATSKAWSTRIPSQKSSSRNGIGPSVTAHNPRSCVTSTMWLTASVSGAISSSIPGSRRQCSTARPTLGRSRLIKALQQPRGSVL
jgi:hypothetical protein